MGEEEQVGVPEVREEREEVVHQDVAAYVSQDNDYV